MKLAVLKETYPGEKRVAVVPANISQLAKLGLEVQVEADAGAAAGFSDDLYREKGAEIVADRASLFDAELILQVRTLGANCEHGRADLPHLNAKHLVIGMCDPLGAPGAVADVARTGASLMALELIPRITRAQSMDVLSSMATVAGYRAVLIAAVDLPRMFPLLMTAAGTLSAARVFVIGAGVAGLQAIATAKRLGAVVRAYDVRPDVREQVESLGGKFVELELETGGAQDKGGYAKALGEEFYQKQRQLMAEVVAESDVVIATAAIPGRKSPLLITRDAVHGMAPGSVIIDLAAERGGNCEPSVADERVVESGVVIWGPTNLPAEVPNHASQMFSNNMTQFLKNLVGESGPELDRDDEIIRDTLVARGGEVIHTRLRELLELPPLHSEVETDADSKEPAPDTPEQGSADGNTADGDTAQTDEKGTS